MAGSGVMRLRLARKSPGSLPHEPANAGKGRYGAAPSKAKRVPTFPNPDTFKAFASQKPQPPKPIDRAFGKEHDAD